MKSCHRLLFFLLSSSYSSSSYSSSSYSSSSYSSSFSSSCSSCSSSSLNFQVFATIQLGFNCNQLSMGAEMHTRMATTRMAAHRIGKPREIAFSPFHSEANKQKDNTKKKIGFLNSKKKKLNNKKKGHQRILEEFVEILIKRGSGSVGGGGNIEGLKAPVNPARHLAENRLRSDA